MSPSTNEALSLTETSHLSAAAAAAEDNDVETDTSKLDPIQDCSEIEVIFKVIAVINTI